MRNGGSEWKRKPLNDLGFLTLAEFDVAVQARPTAYRHANERSDAIILPDD